MVEALTPLDKANVLRLLWTSDGSTLAPESRSLWWGYNGQTEGVVQPWGWLAAIHPADRKQVRQQWATAVNSTRMFTTHYRLGTADEYDQVVHMICVPLFKDAGTLDGWVSWLSKEREPGFTTSPAIALEKFLSGGIIEQAPWAWSVSPLISPYYKSMSAIASSWAILRENYSGGACMIFCLLMPKLYSI
ncbi:hypothetical protein KDK_56340 [Dictyobacter kobayashii]|uniref:Uncharacterized protein n=1 Tax=Dictyobacter kobayashii TaxID=2014872 RepID=A0A402ARV7_9CHLR|nr:PAS domain-containing protein [Dictyobacter kobayashii]GCE21834.1 hypothetical protein KDK_56340 [Dictyobacter kobayashii]